MNNFATTAQRVPHIDAEPRERGSALIWALLFVILTSAMVVSHSSFMSARRGDRDARYNRASMANTFAKSGLQDAVGWFHRRSTQPITAFDPIFDPAGSPPRIDTIDPTIGLVREFEIQGNLWGRYEIRHGEVTDITSQRGNLTPGSIWEIGVRAYVFRRRDASQPFNTGPNQLVGTKTLQSEIRWMQVSPPAAAAICIDDPSKMDLGFRATIDGAGATALAFQDPAVVGGAKAAKTRYADVTGTPALLPMPAYSAVSQRVFGMRMDEVRSYADIVVDEGDRHANYLKLRALLVARSSSDSGSSAPDLIDANAIPSASDQLIYVKGMEILGPLELTNCLLVVDGELGDTDMHTTNISGVVYVSDWIAMSSHDFNLTGALIARGEVRLGVSSDPNVNVTIQHDPAVVEQVRRTVGKYRQRRGGAPE